LVLSSFDIIRDIESTILSTNLQPQALRFLVTLLHEEDDEDICGLLAG
jgi:hypothetical protein